MELPRLTVLNEQYAIRSILGEPGPFEAIYLAWDLENEEQVVIREYLPLALVERVLPGTHVRARGKQQHAIFEYGLKRTQKELSILSKISHPNVVQIRNYFSENDTLYSVYDYHPGASVQNVLDQHGGRISARTAITIMMPFMDGIKTGHKAGLIHGTVSPPNIYLSKTGRPMVLTFKTTHLLLAARTNSLTSFQHPGFSPPEQYATKGKHGPWSDVYGCAATLFSMLTGEILPDVPHRFQGDTVSQLIDSMEELPDSLKEVLTKSLSLDVHRRPSDIETFSILLADSLSIPGAASVSGAPKKTPRKPESTPSDFQATQSSITQGSSRVAPPPSSTPVPAKAPGMQDLSKGSPSQSVTDQATYDGAYPNGDGVQGDHFSSVYENAALGNGFSESYPPFLQDEMNDQHLPAPINESNLVAFNESTALPTPLTPDTKPELFTENRSYSRVDPETAFEYNKPRTRNPNKIGITIAVVIAAGFLFFLSYLIFTRIQSSGVETYDLNEHAYNMIVARGDSLITEAYEIAATSNPEEARDVFDQALENYLAAQSLFRGDPSVRQRIKEIKQYLIDTTEEELLDEKEYLSLFSIGDSLLFLADALVIQGDSVSARSKYREAYTNYLKVFEAFPNDSLASARLRQVSERMTSPKPEPKRVAANTPPPQPTEAEIRLRMFASFKSQGDSAFDARDFDQARRKFIEALEYKPEDPEVVRLLSETERFLAANELRGKYRQHINAGNKLKAAGRLAEARREFELALEALPSDKDAQKAIFEIDSMRDEQARKEQNYLSYRTRGDLLLEQRQYEEALKSYQAALLAKPNDDYAKKKIEETQRDIESLSSLQADLPQGMVTNGIYNFTEEPPELIGGIEVLQSRLRYPPQALEARIEGRVTVRMIVDETGKMSNPTILKSLGYGCDEEVLRVIRGARFEPGRVGGLPVSSWHTLYFEFTL